MLGGLLSAEHKKFHRQVYAFEDALGQVKPLHPVFRPNKSVVVIRDEEVALVDEEKRTRGHRKLCHGLDESPCEEPQGKLLSVVS